MSVHAWGTEKEEINIDSTIVIHFICLYMLSAGLRSMTLNYVNAYCLYFLVLKFCADRKKAKTPPQSELPTQRCSRLDKKRVQIEYKGQIPPQPQLATGYVEAGAKLRESRGGQSLGEDVSKLRGSRDMEYPNIADGDSVAHEV